MRTYISCLARLLVRISFNMNSLRKVLCVVLISGSCMGNVFANGFSLLDQDAFAMARGEAMVATADNASAIYYNPAGIAQLDGNNLRGGVYGIYLNPSYRPPSSAPNSGNTYYSSDHLAAVPQGFYTHTFKLNDRPISVGLGVYAPYGGSISWPQNTGFRQVAISGQLFYLTINPAVALKVAPGLYVGAGLMVNYVDMTFEQGLRAAYQAPNINFYRFRGDGWSVGYNLGAMWQPIEQLSFGANFRSPSTVTLSGHSEFEQFLGHIPDTSLPAHMALTFPLEVIFGTSYRPTPKWNLEIDGHYTHWSSFGTTTIYQSGTFLPGEPQNVPVTFDWQNSWACEAGATRYLGKGWHLSAGYVFNESSVPDAHYSPLAADMNRHFFSIGAGCKGKRFDFDVAYQFGYGPDRTVTGSTPSTPLGGVAGAHPADGTYGFISNALMVSVGMHF
jgi:long-chain fatty acid transport protein